MESVKARIVKFIENNEDEDDDCITKELEGFLVANNGIEGFKNAYLHDMVDRYVGTCNTMLGKDDQFLDKFDMYKEFDNEIFQCPACNWWYAVCEQGEANIIGEIVCDECAAEEESLKKLKKLSE